MNKNKEILLKILEAIGYTDDKEAFTDEFLKNVQLQSMIDLHNSLTSEQQEEFKNKLILHTDDQEKVDEVVKSYFSEEQRRNAFEEASKKAMMEWLEEINPALTDEQRQKLIKLSEELNQDSQSQPSQ